MSKKSKVPSPTQAALLKKMRAEGGPVWRLAGGYWVVGEPDMDEGGTPVSETEELAYWGVGTIRSMETRGWLERTGRWPEEWRDSRRLTQAGLTISLEQGNVPSTSKEGTM